MIDALKLFSLHVFIGYLSNISNCVFFRRESEDTLACNMKTDQIRFFDAQVTLGFGLHCGWAIEGAIGSEYKIDASYLCFACNGS